jgi:hypothetical protein
LKQFIKKIQISTKKINYKLWEKIVTKQIYFDHVNLCTKLFTTSSKFSLFKHKESSKSPLLQSQMWNPTISLLVIQQYSSIQGWCMLQEIANQLQQQHLKIYQQIHKFIKTFKSDYIFFYKILPLVSYISKNPFFKFIE